MAPVINHTITVTIAGTDRTANLRKDSLFVRSNIGNTTDVAEFTIIDNGTFTILDWSEVTIAVNGTIIFGGYITASSGTASGDGPNKTTFWSVECRDWSALFDLTPVFANYIDRSDSDIVTSLFSTWLASETFDAVSQVSTQYDDVDIAFDNTTFREALNQLADVTRSQWYMAPDKTFYWYEELDPAAAAFNIDTVAPDDSTTFDVLANSLKATTDSMEIVNRITVIGGWATSGTKQTDTFTADAAETKYGPLTQPPSSMWSITFTDSDDVEYTAYASDIGVYPSQVTDDEGNTVYDSELAYIVTANLDTQYIDFDLDSISPATLKDGSTITVQYYYKEAITVVRDHTGSQGQYARIFHRFVFDEGLSDLRSATRYADRVLDEFSQGRITVRFDITRHGLLPGRLITINTPAFNISPVLGGLFWTSDRGGYFLLENGSDRLALENVDSTRSFLIQEVAIQTVVTGQNTFMVVASITAGRWIKSLTDSARKASTAQYKAGLRTGNRSTGSLSQITGNLGEVISGKALFTDGGTAQFSWEDYGGHTGAVVGLEDVGQPAPYGAAYILQDGTPRAKMGKMGPELTAVGTVVPDGWGIWTDNGYFSGVVSANAGQIGGWTLAANAIYANGGTISTGVPPLNSSNPGVYMSSAGIYGYGTIGLTFSLPADPSQRPIFSSGTILETVYEVTNASVIRTGTLFPKVQIDNTGIFAWDSGTVLKFSVGASTGIMTAVDGVFSGSVTASQISGGTVSGAVFTGGTVTQGTISAATISGGTITGGYITSGTVISSQITGGNINGALITGGVVSGGTVTGAVFTGGTVTQGTISAATISGGTVTGALVTGGTVSSFGGSVSISDTLGVNIICTSSFSSENDQRWIRWRNITSGAVAAGVGAASSTSLNQAYFHAGTPGTINGEIYLRSYGTATGGASGDYGEVGLKNDRLYFTIVDNGVDTAPLAINKTGITVGKNVVPQFNVTYTLGTAASAFSNTYTRTLTAGTITPLSGDTIWSGGSISPTTNGTYNLGGASNFWNRLYTNNIQSSGNLTLTANGTNRIAYDHSNNSWEPWADGGQSLGRSGLRWSAVWAINGAIQTSDEREKANLQRSQLGLNFISALEPVSWTWKKNDDGRTHYGLSAQRTKRAADSLGVDFGGIIYDDKADRYHLSYSEFIAPLISAMQELTARVEQLEAKDNGRF